MKKPKAAPGGPAPSMARPPAPQGPPGMGAPPGVKPPPGMPTPPSFGAPPAAPMFPQTKPMDPSSAFQGERFSPTAELMRAQSTLPAPQTPMESTTDMGRRIGHLEDKMELMNEKLDLILRELRNLYERGMGRRV